MTFSRHKLRCFRVAIPTAVLAALIAASLPAQAARRVAPQPIPVRFPEGSVHGFLSLRDSGGKSLASGDLLQTVTDSGISSRMSFHFADGSVFEESVLFTQRREFVFRSYHLVQRGPAFSDDLDARLLANGTYNVTSTSHHDREVKKHDGTLTLPPDVSNGMVITLLKNMQRHDSQTVHVVAFTPQPRLVELQLSPLTEQPVLNGRRSESSTEYRLKVHIGGVTGLLAKLLGKIPADTHVWIVTQDVPAFVRMRGPLYMGPVWQIDLTVPGWPRSAQP
jgi:hypothetical protein